LDELGLLPAIEALCERQVAPIHLDIASAVDEGEPRFAPEVETAVYRIVEEALKNVARHAGAGDVAVRLWAEPPTVIVEIEDRGDGFDVDAVLATGATYGLASMRARALSLGGQLSVQSKAGSGTRVIVSLPLPSPIDALPPARLGGHVVR
jgi:signal transduction histidine kinase